ncbi:hypothetical protein Barb7_01989 [Bacteroidales bacterium Barb7]|nr:hypothetical protein Barb7_01989 [Bacteroidales bacterium Barb7]
MKGYTELTAVFTTNKYLITVDAAERGQAFGGGYHDYGSPAELEAEAPYGYHFLKWVNAAGDSLSADNPYKFVVKGYTELTAVFTTNKYLITVDAAERGQAFGGGYHDYGSLVELKAEAPYGYHFLKWVNAAGDSLSADNSYKFAVKGDTELTAVFTTNKYLITVDATEGGQAFGGGYHDYGSPAELEAEAPYGYHFLKWVNAAGDSLSADNSYKFAVKGDTELTAVFTTNKYLITVDATEGGQAFGGGYYDYGSLVELKAVADSGYRFAKWTTGAKFTTHVSDELVYYFRLQSPDASYRANFVKDSGGTGNEFLPTDGEGGVYHADDVLHLVNLEGFVISVGTTDGRQVLQFKANSAEYPAALPVGIYILNAVRQLKPSATETRTIKFVVREN